MEDVTRPGSPRRIPAEPLRSLKPRAIARRLSVPDEAVRLPHDLAAERAVLAAVLVDRSQLDSVREVLKTRDFLDVRHQRIFDAFCELDDAPELRKIDLLTVRAELERTGKLDAAGGAGYLSELSDGVARSSNAADYAKLVRERALSRELHRFGSRIANDAMQDSPAGNPLRGPGGPVRHCGGDFRLRSGAPHRGPGPSRRGVHPPAGGFFGDSHRIPGPRQPDGGSPQGGSDPGRGPARGRQDQSGAQHCPCRPGARASAC